MKVLGLILFSLVAVADPCRVTYQADVTANTTSVRQLAENKARRCLIIQNNGSVAVLIKFNSAHTGTENYSLAAGATFAPIVIPVNAIYIRSASSTAATTIIEGQ